MTEHPSNNDEKHGLISRAIKFVAYPVSAFTGYWVTRNHIRHSMFNKLKDEGELKTIIKPYVEERKKIYEKLKAASTKAEKKLIHEEAAELSHNYTRSIRDRFEVLGLDSLRAQSKDIYKQQYHKALIEGFTGASIVLIGVLSLANNKSLAHLFHHDENIRSRDNNTPER